MPAATRKARSLKPLERLGYPREALLEKAVEDSEGILRDEWRFVLTSR